MEYLLGALLALLGLLGFNYVKRKSAEALLENSETKDSLNKIDKNISNNQGTLLSEEAKRNELLGKLKEAVKDNEDISKFFNDRFNSDNSK